MSKHAQGPRPADALPDDFDATTQPIIAAHFFGFRRKRACGRRALGPGEVAGAYELRKRGPSVRLVNQPEISELPDRPATAQSRATQPHD